MATPSPPAPASIVPPLDPPSYVVPMVLGAAIMVVIGYFTYQQREERVATPLLVGMAVNGLWALADALRLSVTTVPASTLAYKIRMLSASVTGVVILLIVAEFVRVDDRIDRRLLGGLLVVPLVTNVLTWTNGTHEWLFSTPMPTETYVDPVLGSTHLALRVDPGPWFAVHAAYNYVLLLVAAGLLVREYRRLNDVETHKNQVWLIGAAFVFPWVFNALFLAGVTAVELTNVGAMVSMGCIYAAIFRYDLFTLVPIARSTAVENMSEGFGVLDRQNRIVDANPAAVRLTGVPKPVLLDRPVSDVYPGFPDLVADVPPDHTVTDEINVEQDGETRHYDVTVSPILDGDDRFVGRVILFQDITERVQRQWQLEAQKAKLEHQNDHLEQFASIVSHDLRNPLNVIEGRLAMAREDPQAEYFEAMERNVHRMGDLIEDVLTMARQGQSVTETAVAELADVAREAWDHVDHDGSSLCVETERTIECDRDRLLQIFENLFRNAVDHGTVDDSAIDDQAGGDAVTITVGGLANGFYVEDDGRGFPDDESTALFEHGYTTDPDGTGLGLSIVATAVEAHGWTIDCTEGSDGGARFEISGVDRRETPREPDSTDVDAGT